MYTITLNSYAACEWHIRRDFTRLAQDGIAIAIEETLECFRVELSVPDEQLDEVVAQLDEWGWDEENLSIS